MKGCEFCSAPPSLVQSLTAKEENLARIGAEVCSSRGAEQASRIFLTMMDQTHPLWE